LSAAIAVKSLVNDEVEMLGAEEELDDVDELVELAAAGVLALLELDFELPHPAAKATTRTPNTHSRNRLKPITSHAPLIAATSTVTNSC